MATMQAVQASAAQQKLAERLTILNERGQGLLIRLYNIKKMLASADAKPPFLSDKALEPAIRSLTKRFPAIDTKSGNKELQPLAQAKEELVRHLSMYYFTFVDIMDFKSHVNELLSRVDSCQIHFDITLNFDLTRAYLDLIVCYVSMMVILTRVDDRRVVISLFEYAHELLQQMTEKNFPRLAQLFVDYDSPMRKLAEDFSPHARCVGLALGSLRDVYARRIVRAENWRSAQTLSILAEPLKMINAVQTDTMPCEYLSVDSMDRWIVLGYLVCHQLLNEEQNVLLWKQALTNCFVVSLCRDEVLQVHSFVAESLQNVKNLAKRVSDVKEWYNQAITSAPQVHRDRRKYLRTALRELTLVFEDQPGLLGPKALFVFMGLCFARDEICWLLRHVENAPTKKGTVKINMEDLVDRLLPELLFYVEELRNFVKKYSQVLQRYYVGFMSGYDSYDLADIIRTTVVSEEEESVILSSFVSDLMQLNVKDVEENAAFDFRGLRLDWMRLQAYMSMGRSAHQLKDQRKLATLLNTVVFHSRMVDAIDDILKETSDLSIYCFYLQLMEAQFKQCLEFPSQQRYIIAFPMLTAHFTNACHELCPEECHTIGVVSDQYAAYFVRDIADEVCQLLFRQICRQHNEMSEKLLPTRAVALMVQNLRRKKEKKDKKTPANSQQSGAPTQSGADSAQAKSELPGAESIRKNRDQLTEIDKAHMCLVELCTAINHTSLIQVYERGFVPKELFSKLLEFNFNGALARLTRFSSETPLQIARPSEVLHHMKTIMDELQTLENYVQMDVARVFNSVLLQQTQPKDGFVGETTIAAHYVEFYFELMKRSVVCPVVFSPLQRSFVTITTDMLNALHAAGVGSSTLAQHSTTQALNQLSIGNTQQQSSSGSIAPVTAEHFTSYSEMKALAELLGPYGARFVCDRATVYTMNQLDEIKKLIMLNRETLRDLRRSYDQPERMRELGRQLQGAEIVLQRMTIIGVLLSFRNLLLQATNEQIEKRMPFLFGSIVDFKDHVPNVPDEMRNLAGTREAIVNELCAAAGFERKVDPLLFASLRDHRGPSPDEDYEISCLLMVCVAVCLPRLAFSEGSIYLPHFEGHLNNIHCLAVSINAMANVLFHFHAKNDTEERLKEFLALASASLLRLGQDAEDNGAVKNLDSIYILLDLIVQKSAYLTPSLLERCFPYVLLRNAYHAVYKIVKVDLTEKAANSK